MITHHITGEDFWGRPYDPSQLIEEEARDLIEDGESLNSHLFRLSTHPKVLLRRVLLELIEVSVIGLFEKVRSEGWTKE